MRHLLARVRYLFYPFQGKGQKIWFRYTQKTMIWNIFLHTVRGKGWEKIPPFNPIDHMSQILKLHRYFLQSVTEMRNQAQCEYKSFRKVEIRIRIQQTIQNGKSKTACITKDSFVWQIHNPLSFPSWKAWHTRQKLRFYSIDFSAHNIRGSTNVILALYC